MATLSLEQAARLTGQGKAILARAISGRFFAGNKEDGSSNVDSDEMAPLYPLPAPVETRAELRSRLDLAAYGAYLAGDLVDHELSEAEVAEAVAALPKVPA